MPLASKGERCTSQPCKPRPPPRPDDPGADGAFRPSPSSLWRQGTPPKGRRRGRRRHERSLESEWWPENAAGDETGANFPSKPKPTPLHSGNEDSRTHHHTPNTTHHHQPQRRDNSPPHDGEAVAESDPLGSVDGRSPPRNEGPKFENRSRQPHPTHTNLAAPAPSPAPQPSPTRPHAHTHTQGPRANRESAQPTPRSPRRPTTPHSPNTPRRQLGSSHKAHPCPP
jgi:hypothetical protein